MDSAYDGPTQPLRGKRARTIAEWQAVYDELKQAYDRLVLALTIEQATVAGLESELRTVRHNHPNSHLYEALTDFKFEDGTPKTFGRLAFERGFDRFLREKGLDPLEYRRN